jgi:hypothetical protein
MIMRLWAMGGDTASDAQPSMQAEVGGNGRNNASDA